MLSTVKFIVAAVKAGRAYIDMDGTLLKRFPVPEEVYSKLDWWKANLQPIAVIRRRLPLLYILRALGVQLRVWTNRAPKHEQVTRAALGIHAKLFEMFLFYDGAKGPPLFGPVMDDSPEMVATCLPGSLLVESL